MFDRKSDYALNKMNPDAIVYRDVTGRLYRITRDDFSSEAEFLYWKAISDEDYHVREMAEHIQSNNTRPLSDLFDAAAAASPETLLVTREEKQERKQLYHLLMSGLDRCLTATQRRRLWMNVIDEMTVRQIADAENVKHPSVVESLTAAKKKLMNHLKKQ